MKMDIIKRLFYRLFRKNESEYSTKSGIILKKTYEPVFEGRVYSIETHVPDGHSMLIITPEEFKEFSFFYNLLTGQNTVPIKFYKKFGDYYQIFNTNDGGISMGYLG